MSTIKTNNTPITITGCALLTASGINVYSSLTDLQNAVNSTFSSSFQYDSEESGCFSSCFTGSNSESSQTTAGSVISHIPYYNILWVQEDHDTDINKNSDSARFTHSSPLKVSFMNVKNASAHKLVPALASIIVVSPSGSYFPSTLELNKFLTNSKPSSQPKPPTSPNEESCLLISRSPSPSNKKYIACKSIDSITGTLSYQTGLSKSKNQQSNVSSLDNAVVIVQAPGQQSLPETSPTSSSINKNSDSTLIMSPADSIPAFTKHTIQSILQYAYSSSPDNTTNTFSHTSKLQKRFLVIINPHGGPGKAKKIYEQECAPVLAMANCKTTVIETTHRFHATEIAQEMQFLVPKSLDSQSKQSISDSSDDLDFLQGDNTDGNSKSDVAYDAIICCSGDGIPHEIINGLIDRPQGDGHEILKRIPLAQLPCGSGNSMAVSLHGHSSPSAVSLGFVKGRRMDVDLMLLTQGPKKALSFLTQAFGIIADADLGTEDLRWMGGARFDVGVAKRLLAMNSYPCDIYVKYSHKTKTQVKQHFVSNNPTGEYGTNDPIDISQYTTLTEPQSTQDLMTPHYGTVNDPVPEDWDHIDGSNLNMFYAGKMPWVSADALMFPAILPTDGAMDLIVFNTNVSRFTAAKTMLSIQSGTHVDFNHAQYSKVSAYRLVPKKEKGYLSIDGESFPHVPFQVETVPKAGCLLTPTGTYYQTGYGKY